MASSDAESPAETAKLLHRGSFEEKLFSWHRAWGRHAASGHGHTEKAEATRARIIETAMRLLVARGLAGATVAEICKEARVSKGSFFYFFPNKDDAVVAAVRSYGDMRKADFLSCMLPNSEDPLEILYATIDCFQSAMPSDASQTCLLGRLAHESDGVSEQVHAACREQLGRWRGWTACVISECMVAYPPRLPVAPEPLANLFIATFEGALVIARLDKDMGVLGKSFDYLRQTIAIAFGPRPPKPPPGTEPTPERIQAALIAAAAHC